MNSFGKKFASRGESSLLPWRDGGDEGRSAAKGEIDKILKRVGGINLVPRLRFWLEWLRRGEIDGRKRLNAVLINSKLPSHLFHLFAAENLRELLSISEKNKIYLPEVFSEVVREKFFLLKGSYRRDKFYKLREELNRFLEGRTAVLEKRLTLNFILSLEEEGFRSAMGSCTHRLFPEEHGRHLALMERILINYIELLEGIIFLLKERGEELSGNPNLNHLNISAQLEKGIFF